MAEYIEREAVISAIKKDPMGGLNYKSIVNEIPPADVQSVVRCKDCKYCHIEDEYEAWCYGGMPAQLTRADDDFCSHGKWREQEPTQKQLECIADMAERS